MGKGKLAKFADMETYENVFQYPYSVVEHVPFEMKGHWHEQYFKNENPIVLELGCGKGEYTVELAKLYPQMNFIGVDIKGARLWKGAKEATEEKMGNVAFLRTRIEFIDAFFGPGEVSQIWLTFSDPQLRGSENARLTSPLFLQRYSHFLVPDGIVHLKTDSRFLYEYTQSVIRANRLEVLASGVDIYNAPLVISSDAGGGVEKSLQDLDAVFEVQTFYETMFLKMGLPITYLAFRLRRPDLLEDTPFAYPENFDAAYWREAEGPRRTFSHQPTKG